MSKKSRRIVGSALVSAALIASQVSTPAHAGIGADLIGFAIGIIGSQINGGESKKIKEDNVIQCIGNEYYRGDFREGTLCRKRINYCSSNKDQRFRLDFSRVHAAWMKGDQLVVHFKGTSTVIDECWDRYGTCDGWGFCSATVYWKPGSGDNFDLLVTSGGLSGLWFFPCTYGHVRESFKLKQILARKYGWDTVNRNVRC